MSSALYDPAISGEVKKPANTFDFVPWNADKAIARRAAMELSQGEAVNLGFGISALVPYILLEEGYPEAVTWVIEQGAVGGLPLLDFQFGCSVNAQAIIPSPEQFTYFQGGGFDRSMLSFLEVDQYGSVNVSRIAARPHITAGAGGFVDITAHAKNIVFSGYFTTGGLRLNLGQGQRKIEREGKVKKFVPQVEQTTFSGRRARELGQNYENTMMNCECFVNC